MHPPSAAERATSTRRREGRALIPRSAKEALFMFRLLGLLTVLLGGCTAVTAEPAAEPGHSFRDCRQICPELVVVPPGSYLMGSAVDDPHQAKDGIEQPQHRVTIPHAFAVGKFEVTRDEYARFALETQLRDPDGCNVHEPPHWPKRMGLSWHATAFPQSGRDPAVCVSWDEAQAYVEWLSKKTGHSYRLLSEAEWEYAARAGTTGQAFWGNDEHQACMYGNGVDALLVEKYPQKPWESLAPRNPNPGHVLPCRDGHVFTAPVGSYGHNAFGLYDTAGNVMEWVADCWSANYDGAPSDGSARTDGDCADRVNRGGAWDSNPTGLRSAYRWNDARGLHVVDLGFRVARELSPQRQSPSRTH
jgi:formylglycine-generating enzyme